MKKYFTIILLLICVKNFGQVTGRQPYYKTQQTYSGDTVSRYFTGDSVKWYSDKPAFAFDKPVYVQGSLISGNTWPTDSFNYASKSYANYVWSKDSANYASKSYANYVWSKDSANYASKSYANYVWSKDSANYISKSQARSDINDSITAVKSLLRSENTWPTDSSNYASKSMVNDSINALDTRTNLAQQITSADTTRWGTESGGTQDSTWNKIIVGTGNDTTSIWQDGTIHQYYNGSAKIKTDTTGLVQSTAGTSSTFITHGGVLKDFYTDAGNVSTSETDLYSYTVPANVLATNGDKLIAEYSGEYEVTSSNLIKAYFAGTNIFADPNTILNSPAGEWRMTITIIRVSSTVARATVHAFGFDDSGGKDSDILYSELTSKDWTTTNILKITGQAVITDEIVAKIGYIQYKPAGVN